MAFATKMLAEPPVHRLTALDDIGDADARKGRISHPAAGGRMTYDDDEFEYVFVRFITLRNGKRLYAASVGLKAFRIRVRKR